MRYFYEEQAPAGPPSQRSTHPLVNTYTRIYHLRIYFFGGQAQRLVVLGHEPIAFDDLLCQLVDAANPRSVPGGIRGGIRLSDLRRRCEARVASKQSRPVQTGGA